MNLTLRTSENFDSKIDELKIRLDLKAASKVIDHVVCDYSYKCDELISTQRKLDQLQRKHSDLIGVLRQKHQAEQNLLKVIEASGECQIPTSFSNNLRG